MLQSSLYPPEGRLKRVSEAMGLTSLLQKIPRRILTPAAWISDSDAKAGDGKNERKAETECMFIHAHVNEVIIPAGSGAEDHPVASCLPSHRRSKCGGLGTRRPVPASRGQPDCPPGGRDTRAMIRCVGLSAVGATHELCYVMNYRSQGNDTKTGCKPTKITEATQLIKLQRKMRQRKQQHMNPP